jgi:hypothetical protein
MKKMIILSFVILQGLLVFGQNAQQKEAEVRAMEAVEVNAVLQRDTAMLRKIWAADFMVNAPINIIAVGGQVEMVNAGILSYTSFTRNIERVMVMKELVITMGNEIVVPAGTNPMAGQTIQRRYSNLWMKEKGKWIMVARHANNICPGISK